MIITPSADALALRNDADRVAWLKMIALVGLLVIPTTGAVAGAPAATNSEGAVAGLKPKFADVNGIRTRYYEMGQGEPMLLIHGGGWAGSSNANNWSTVIPGFAPALSHFRP